MNKKKLTSISLFVIAACVLGGWLIWQFFFPTPIAQWVFYGEKPSEVRGYIYPPAKNSTTGKIESRPATPEGDGALLTLWTDIKQCSLSVKSGPEKINITRFQDSNIQSVQVQYIDNKGRVSELNAQLEHGVSLWTYPDGIIPGYLIGWKFDNLAGKPIPVSYRGKTLIDGTQYKRLPNNHWLYERYQRGKVIESKELDKLPVVNVEQHREHEQNLISMANHWLNDILQNMSYTLSVPIPDQWLSKDVDPCQSVNTEM